MHADIKCLGIVIVTAVYCLCSIKRMRDIINVVIEKIGYPAELAEKEEREG